LKIGKFFGRPLRAKIGERLDFWNLDKKAKKRKNNFCRKIHGNFGRTFTGGRGGALCGRINI